VAGQGLRPPAPDVSRLTDRDRAHMNLVRDAGRGGIALRTRHMLPAGLRRKLPEFPCPHCGFVLTVQPGQDPGSRGLCASCRRVVTVPERS
jgi:hypothetical protein